jgi:U3 small nucleolar RNA-associated protein 6
MLAELKDLGEKGLFSPTEIKHIIKKRTAFETTLVRRIPNKNDYLRYAAYEMGLEALRRKRAARLSEFVRLPFHSKTKIIITKGR